MRSLFTRALDVSLKANKVAALPPHAVAQLLHALDEGAIAERQQVQILVTRHQLAERLRRKQRLEGVQRSALVDVDQPPSQHGALHHQLVLGPHEITRGRIDRFADRDELHVQRSNRARGHVCLTIQIGDFRRQVVHRTAQLAHAPFEVFPLAS